MSSTNGPNGVNIECGVLGEVKPLSMSKVSEDGDLEGVSLGESLVSEDGSDLGSSIGMSEGNGFGNL